MNTLKYLDTTIFDVRGDRPRGRGDLGIEIEAEGPYGGQNPAYKWEKNRIELNRNSNFWQVKEDHSLRNGLEYVSRGPVSIEKLTDAMEEWSLLTKGTKFREDSIRTSVHYHVNVSDLTINQVLAAIVGYWLIETPLVDTQGATRVGNLFCLRVSDADFLVNDLCSSLENDGVPLMGNTLGDNVKYAALNINAVRRFGSLEFRFNKGTTDPKEIERWGRFFFGMVQLFADMGSPTGVIRFIEEKGSMALFEHVVPLWLRKEVTRKAGWLQAIESNYSYAYMVHSKLEDIKRQGETEPNIIVSRRHMFAFDPDAHDDHGFPYQLPDFQDFSPDEEDAPKTTFIKGGRKKRFKSTANLLAQVGLGHAPPPPEPFQQVNWNAVLHQAPPAHFPADDDLDINNADGDF